MRGKNCKKQSKDPTEAQIQQSIIEWCEWKAKQYPALGMIYHIPNGGLRSKSEAALFKRLGVRAGMPDLCLPVRSWCGYFHALYLEIKTLNGKISKQQSERINALSQYNNMCKVVYSTENAIWQISNHLNIPQT